MTSASSARGADDCARAGDRAADETLQGAPHLRDFDNKLAFGRLHTAGPHTVAVASGVRSALVVRLAQEQAHLFFDGLLHDQLSAEPAQFGEPFRISVPILDQLRDGLFNPGARGYSFLHGAVLLSVVFSSSPRRLHRFVFYSTPGT